MSIPSKTSDPAKLSRSDLDLALERKVRRSSGAMFFERLWPRLWLIVGLAFLFVIASMLDVWTLVGDVAHRGLIALFGTALLAAIIYCARTPWPSREQAIRRIEQESGIAHRPATSYEDTLSGAVSDPATMALWQAHKARLAALIDKLRPGSPRPRTDRFDPFAIRALLLIGAVLFTGLVGDRAAEKLRAAFRFGDAARLVDARLDAWVTPPVYTGKPPIMLADGAKRDASATPADGKTIEVPERSVLVVRAVGTGGARLALEIDGGGAGVERIEAQAPAASTGDVVELRHELRRTANVRIVGGGSALASWSFLVTPDQPPVIALVKDPERTPRGAMKLTYTVADDYGVQSAAAKLAKLRAKDGDPATAWARKDVLKGPRPPLERPPVLALRLPRPDAKPPEATSHLELGAHPWAGLRVAMTLEAKDVAGNVGRSAPLEMILPGRVFKKPLARAVVEQRRLLVDDPRYRPRVVMALDALTLEPDGFIAEADVYLGLRTVYYRLKRSKSRATIQASIEQLWHIALKIEDGDLSDAEKRLKDAQEKLSKALEEGASDEEIKRLMDELKQAMNDFMQQLAKESDGMQSPDGMNQDQQSLSQQDLDRMMKNIEEMAKNGSREQAQQMLSELRDLMERLQSGRMAEQQQRQNQEMMKKMDELGGIVGEQQKLQDDTFGEQRKQGEQQDGQGPQQRGQQKGQQRGQQQGQQGQRGDQQQRGERGQNQQGQKGQQGQGQGQQGQGQQGQGQQQGQGSPLGQRQAQLREKLDRLQRDLRELGAGDTDKLAEAERAMGNAERALEQGDFEGAAEEQGKALDQMRQGAQQMAQEMMRNMPQRFGQNGDTPRDPLGRPQRSEGPDQGTSVKVPSEIDMQRAREILEELRRRAGEATRPPVELDYLDRLLRRF